MEVGFTSAGCQETELQSDVFQDGAECWWTDLQTVVTNNNLSAAAAAASPQRTEAYRVSAAASDRHLITVEMCP